MAIAMHLEYAGNVTHVGTATGVMRDVRKIVESLIVQERQVVALAVVFLVISETNALVLETAKMGAKLPASASLVWMVGKVIYVQKDVQQTASHLVIVELDTATSANHSGMEARALVRDIVVQGDAMTTAFATHAQTVIREKDV